MSIVAHFTAKNNVDYTAALSAENDREAYEEARAAFGYDLRTVQVVHPSSGDVLRTIWDQNPPYFDFTVVFTRRLSEDEERASRHPGTLPQRLTAQLKEELDSSPEASLLIYRLQDAVVTPGVDEYTVEITFPWTGVWKVAANDVRSRPTPLRDVLRQFCDRNGISGDFHIVLPERPSGGDGTADQTAEVATVDRAETHARATLASGSHG